MARPTALKWQGLGFRGRVAAAASDFLVQMIFLLFPKIRKAYQKIPEGPTNSKILKCKRKSNDPIRCRCLRLVLKQSKSAWETGGRWEVEAAGRVMMLMILWCEVQGFTRKRIYPEPNSLRRDLLPFNPSISALRRADD